MKASEMVLDPPAVETTTSTVPAAFAGVVTTTDVWDTSQTVAAVPPNVTVTHLLS